MDTDIYVATLPLIIVFVLLLYHLTTRKFDYWKKKNVPYRKPLPLFGNYASYILMQKSQAAASQELCKKFLNEPYFGSFYGTEPALVIQDPEIIKLIFTKDFHHFNSRELMDFTQKEVITTNMFFNYGDDWKFLRQHATTLFTSAKLKNMFHLVEKTCQEFESMLDHETSVTNVLETRKIMIRYTMAAICSCVFGVDTDTQGKDAEHNPFTIMGRAIFSSSYVGGFKIIARAMWPNIFYGVGLQCFPAEIDQFFGKLVKEVFKSREHKSSSRNDLMDLMLALKNRDSVTYPESMSEEFLDKLIISQAVAFFSAGFETSAGALSLTVYELAKNRPAQRRAQKEIDEFLLKYDNKLNYDNLKELIFLDACVSETLRLYPVLPIIAREVVHEYTFPSGLHLERGMRVHLPVFHLHRRADLFPDPEQYKPERFMPDEGHTIKPYTYFPFGEGPRTCIGLRFSKMQVLSGLVTFLKKFEVKLPPGAPEVLEFEPTTFLLQPTSNLPVKVTKREA